MKRILFALLFVLGTAWAQPVTIEVWHSLSKNYGAPDMEAFVEEFNESHPDIHVDLVYAGGYSDALKKAQAAMAAGKAPNVAMFEQTLGAGFVDAGVILPLNSLIESQADFNLDDFFKPLLATCTYGDTLYCLPFNTSTPVIYYNRDVFDELGLEFPDTWEELLEVGPKLATYNANGELERYGLNLDTAPGWLFDSWMGQAGGSYLNEAGDAFVFNGEDAVQMLDFWQKLVEADAAIVSDTGEDWWTGRQVIYMASTATLEDKFTRAEFTVGASPLWCGEQCYSPIGGANFYLMDTGSEAQKEASWTFLNWVTQPERYARFAAATGYMAGRKSALDTEIMKERFEERPEARITYEQMEAHGHPRTLVPFWGEVNSLLTNITEEVMLGGVPPQQALDQAVEEANRLLEVYAR